MNRFLICVARSDDLLHTSYFILDDLNDAKASVYQNLPDVDTLNEDNEGNRNLKITCKVWMGKYTYLVEIEQGMYTITYQIIPISINDEDYICVSHSYPGDMDFQVEKVGTYSDCFGVFQKFETEIKFIEIGSGYYRRLFPSGGSAGFAVDILQYHTPIHILRVTRECNNGEIVKLGEFQSEKNAIKTLKRDFTDFLDKYGKNIREASTHYIHHDPTHIQSLLFENKVNLAVARFIDNGKTYKWNIEKALKGGFENV